MRTETIAVDVNLWWFGRVDANVFAAWGQVIGAIATVAAVIVAVGIAIRDGRKSKKEADTAERERQRAELERQRADADRQRSEEERRELDAKHARLVLLSPEVGTFRNLDTNEQYTWVLATITNHGSDPVLDLAILGVEVINFVTGETAARVDVQSAGGPNPLMPNQPVAWLEARVGWEDGQVPDREIVYMVTTFAFTDVNGKRWRRIGQGPPTQDLQQSTDPEAQKQ